MPVTYHIFRNMYQWWRPTSKHYNIHIPVALRQNGVYCMMHFQTIPGGNWISERFQEFRKHCGVYWGKDEVNYETKSPSQHSNFLQYKKKNFPPTMVTKLKKIAHAANVETQHVGNLLGNWWEHLWDRCHHVLLQYRLCMWLPKHLTLQVQF